jgi:hypothetical protein
MVADKSDVIHPLADAPHETVTQCTPRLSIVPTVSQLGPRWNRHGRLWKVRKCFFSLFSDSDITIRPMDETGE